MPPLQLRKLLSDNTGSWKARDLELSGRELSKSRAFQLAWVDPERSEENMLEAAVAASFLCCRALGFASADNILLMLAGLLSEASTSDS